jgi:hypothetical protein
MAPLFHVKWQPEWIVANVQSMLQETKMPCLRNDIRGLFPTFCRLNPNEIANHLGMAKFAAQRSELSDFEPPLMNY